MTTFDDLPAAAVRLITRAARTRRISGTNRFARICRTWRDAGLNNEDQEQLQLLLPLEGLPADSLTSTSEWLSQHGVCVTSLHITYEPETAPLFQQLPLSSAPLVGLARLEVDGPDSLVALAPALPQLVALTHLRAYIGVALPESSLPGSMQGVFSAQGEPLEDVPSLQQLCPGLKSLKLALNNHKRRLQHVVAPVEELLPDGLEQLHIHRCSTSFDITLPCAALTSLTSLRCLTLDRVNILDPDLLLTMPGLEELQLLLLTGRVQEHSFPDDWLAAGACTTPQHLTKLTGMSLTYNIEALAPVLAGATHLCKLELLLVDPGAAAWVQQLAVLTGLRQLTLHLAARDGDAAAALLTLSSLKQLTCLRLGVCPSKVASSTWAEVLPHLTQLRVLGVTEGQLLGGGLSEEVAKLPQLQCLYVSDEAYGFWDPPGTVERVAHHLPVLSQCSSLRAVLCWSVAQGAAPSKQRLAEYVHEGRLHLSYWYKWRDAAVEGRVVCPRSCPHLPGVWELQQQEAAGV
jgi:hypothetical protein